MRKAIVLFADAPTPDLARSEFPEGFSDAEAFELKAAYYRDVYESMCELQDEDEGISLIVCYFPAHAMEAFEQADLNGCLMLGQRGKEPAERIANCVEDLDELGFERFVLVVDAIPTIDAECLREAFDLVGSAAPVVIGLTEGGFPVLGAAETVSALRLSNFGDLLSRRAAFDFSLEIKGIAVVSGVADLRDAANLIDLEKRLKSLEEVPHFTRKMLQKLKKLSSGKK